ncbi:helix-turn-helix transcriptional regulator [Streptomyces sp. NPDC004610]|uniref:helix-turn-helix domain-containing protein n=1 Tax=unclassified Streptomyces TaxID=2593676 RepID=UPI0033BE269E
MARERSGPTAQQRVLAQRLQALRAGAGLSVTAAAEALGAHPATVRRIEQARTSLDGGQVRTLLDAYGAPPSLVEAFLAQLAQANLPGWWHEWRDVMDGWQLELMGVESASSLVRVWDPALVPALLRTPAYARAVEAAQRPDLPPAVRERRVDLLAERQKRLAQQGSRVWAVMPAGVLLTDVGAGPEVMDEQTGALAAAADRRNVTLQLHPRETLLHPLVGVSALTLYRLDAPDLPDHVVTEGGLPGTAVHSDSPTVVTRYRMLMDRSCAMALHPTSTREALG